MFAGSSENKVNRARGTAEVLKLRQKVPPQCVDVDAAQHTAETVNVCVLLNKHTPVWVHLSVCHLCSKLQAHSHEHVQVKHAATVSCRVSLVVTRSMLRIITLVFVNQSQFTKCLMATEQHTLWTVVPERLSPSRLLVCLPLTMLRFTKPSSFAQNSSWKHGFSVTQGIKPLTSASINVFKEELNSFSVTVMLPGFVSSLSSSLGCDVSS